jgi:hypothetical protein
MDLKELDTTAACERGFELELLHPSTAMPLSMFITVVGRDSDTFTKLQNEQNRQRLGRAQKLGNRPMISLDDIEHETIDVLAACTRSWRRIVSEEGEQKGQELATLLLDDQELTCTKANATKLFTRMKWVREQVDAAVMDRANFLKR